MTHLDVRLLITPVVVSYCVASAKMSAIPIWQCGQSREAVQRPRGSLTNARVKVRDDRSERDDEQLQMLAEVGPLVRVAASEIQSKIQNLE